MLDSVLVTGATGFVASHIVDDLLLHGFKVIGTTRSKKKAVQFTHIFQEKYPELAQNITFEQIKDISNIDEVVTILRKFLDLKYIIHTAQPTPVGQLPKGTDLATTFRKPAVENSLGILNAVQSFPNHVKSIVFTSSISTMMRQPQPGEKVVITNTDWSPSSWEDVGDSESLAYNISKIYVEKAIWKWADTNKP
ncbi:unnamed protein product [Ambrosiozyma monospora]|uniref:Unnamed protein product n=1 Tax=Ambrosiozyma monospora TaxID=43982 RepID=A0A9W7DKM0_AMBMO|nr:unnamed protein product [Ambrosiozyma monospora]